MFGVSNYQGKPADRSSHPAYPSIEADLGYNPARFLDHDLLETGDRDTTESNRQLVRAVIRGLQSVAAVRAWRGVELNLAHEVYDREPRHPVLEWLAEREAELEEDGDLDERLAAASIPPREERATRRTASDYREMPVAKPRPSCAIQWGTPTEQLAEKCVEEARI